MRKAIAVAAVVFWAMCLIAQTNQQASQPEVPKTCTERNLLRDSKGRIVWFTHEQMKARATKMVAPKMSTMVSRAARIEGTVLVGVVVGEDGRVKCMWVLLGHPLLTQDVLRAVQRWEFKPETSKGKPKAFAGYLEFHFKYGYTF